MKKAGAVEQGEGALERREEAAARREEASGRRKAVVVTKARETAGGREKCSPCASAAWQASQTLAVVFIDANGSLRGIFQDWSRSWIG